MTTVIRKYGELELHQIKGLFIGFAGLGLGASAYIAHCGFEAYGLGAGIAFATMAFILDKEL